MDIKSTNLIDVYESDEYVSGYHSEPGLRLDRIVANIDFKDSDKVLDVGCGNGLLLDLVHNKIESYTGIDISNKFIDVAKQRAKEHGITNAEFVCEDINKINEFTKFNKNKFDKAFALDFTEHINDEELIKLFGSIKNLINNNGSIYIHTPNARFFMEIMKDKGIILKQFEEHIGVRTVKEYEDLFNNAGLRVNKVLMLPHYVRGLRLLHILSYIPVIGKYFEARIFMELKKA